MEMNSIGCLIRRQEWACACRAPGTFLSTHCQPDGHDVFAASDMTGRSW
jgi:hypothetical protein